MAPSSNMQKFNADAAIIAIGVEYSQELLPKASQWYPLLMAAELQEAYAFDAIWKLLDMPAWLMIVAYTLHWNVDCFM